MLKHILRMVQDPVQCSGLGEFQLLEHILRMMQDPVRRSGLGDHEFYQQCYYLVVSCVSHSVGNCE